MSWALLALAILGLSAAVTANLIRRAELSRLAHSVAERERAVERGSHRARLQYPQVDLRHCVGCGACVRACPEAGVLDMIHGQAMVVHGARCVGHGLCARECPTGAIVVALGDLEERRDIPALDERFGVPSVPGLYLAGEVTGYALIRTAIAHGTQVANEVALKDPLAPERGPDHSSTALCVVGAGPAGIACALEAKRLGLDFVVLDQAELGGTVAKYPRRKLVMTQPVELPLHGKLTRDSYSKEELMEMWESLARDQELPIVTGVRVENVEQDPAGFLRVHTSQGEWHASNVCLALGRRGTPRRLGVPGEELPKVSYGLVDAQSYQERRVLVVGGGDSAVEAALALAEQGTNEVVLSYRKAHFTRLKARNEVQLEKAIASGELSVLFESQVTSIEPKGVDLTVGSNGSSQALHIENDEVFVFAGGIPPFEMLEKSGISFDPADRPATEATERGSGLLPALATALIVALVALAWALIHRDYYALPLAQRSVSPGHGRLSPSGTIGLGLGIGASLAILANLAYLARRSPLIPLRLGSLKAWMTSHLVTGVLAFLLALLHGAMAPRDAMGGHSLIALAILVATGAIGRYFYSFVPRAANGRELELDEVRADLARLSADWDRERHELGDRFREHIQGLVAGERWRPSFFARLLALATAHRRLRRSLGELRQKATAEGLSDDQTATLLGIARRAQRAALSAAHFEELRALIASWRWMHRWVALLMVLLVAAHVAFALLYGDLLK